MFITPYGLLGRQRLICVCTRTCLYEKANIYCTHVKNDIFSHNTIPPKYLFTDFCTVFWLSNDLFWNVFSDQAAQTCFWTCPFTIRFAALMPRMLNKIVQQRMSQSLSTRLTKSVSGDPQMWRYLSETHFLTRLPRCFAITRFTMFWYYHLVIKQTICAYC